METRSRHKKTVLNTEKQCANQGIQLLPLIFEAAGGGWDLSTRRLVTKMAEAVESKDEPKDANLNRPASLLMAQRLSVRIHTHIGRARARRAMGLDISSDPIGPIS